MPRTSVSWCVRLYQATLSPDHGIAVRWMFPRGFCRFHPSCSEYGRISILKHGVFFGSTKSLWRILRCNPFARGGVDVP
ncbi:MAG: membrane protein insertion efficiency factor YidD [bacterium]|nr:membrane protein insertion efficiency factor YidD [bacterium]